MSTVYEMFVDALKRILKDDGFSVPSQSAKDAIRTSELLLQWMTDEDKRGIVGVNNLWFYVSSNLQLCDATNVRVRKSLQPGGRGISLDQWRFLYAHSLFNRVIPALHRIAN